MNAIKEVPVFKLYGETVNWSAPDLLHMESIAERSVLHDWHIHPHQHADLVQVLYVQHGHATLEIEGRELSFRQPALQVVPPLCVHGFRFAEDVNGFILSLALPLVEDSAQTMGTRLLTSPHCHLLEHDDHLFMTSLFERLWLDYQGREEGRDAMLASLVKVLLIWLHRRERETSGIRSSLDRGEEYVARFLELLEQHFREHWPIERYASQLKISTPHLNSLCRRLCHQSALQMVHQRLVLEAKRCLVYTSMTVSEVSDSLGFTEPAYFSRFFKRYTGVPPREFRLHGGRQGINESR